MAAAAAIAIAVWWTANTVSHLFIHRPFFRGRAANAGFAALLTALLGFPHALWRDRHLAHHRGVRYRFHPSAEIILQGALIAAVWSAMAVAAPAFFASAYLPGYAVGLLVCAIHGHYEHAGGTTSHYGRLYNALCFNDGYHVEHHRHPSARWSALPSYRSSAARASAWPAPLRWVEDAARHVLAMLERLVLRSRILQRWVLRVHSRAFERLPALQPPPRDIVIVGGGLFPRTALVLRSLMPRARITIVDASEANLNRARAILNDPGITFVNAHFTDRAINQPSAICNLQCDVIVFPLSFHGDRSSLYDRPPARTVVIHDWIWRARGTSRIVSLFLLKRVNLVTA